MPEPLCLHESSMGPAMRSCGEFDLLIVDCSQSPYNYSEPDSHCRSEQALSPKHWHAHVQPNKSCPALCSSWTIIVCLVQLHLKWQRPRATGRIKHCVQSKTLCTSCQRGCAAFFSVSCSPSFLSHSLLICRAQKHPLFPPVLHKSPLWFPFSLTLLFSLALWTRSDLPPANCLCSSLAR